MVTPLENGFLPPALMSGQPLGGNKSNWNINSKVYNVFISFEDITAPDEFVFLKLNSQTQKSLFGPIAMFHLWAKTR